MKKCLFFLLLLLTTLAASAQTTDAQLNQRMAAYLQLNKALQFDQIMDYIHPVLFTVAPKEAMKQSLEQAFNNEQMKITIDSIQVLTVGPDFKEGEAVYKKVDYFMGISMVFKDNALEDETFRQAITERMKEGFKGKTVRYDESKKALVVQGTEIMFAIKDNAKAAWMFLGYQKNPQLVEAIFPKAVIAHYSLL